GANSDITSLTGLTTDLSVAQGGTGLSSPGTSGNVLTSNGAAWVSQAPASRVTSVTASVPLYSSGGATPNIVLGTVTVANGGTGADTIAAARTNLGLGTMATQNSNAVSITGGSISGVTGVVTSVSGSGGTTGLTLTGGPITTSGTLTLGGTLAVANGGTGASTAATARANLGAAASGANSDITRITGLNIPLSTTQGGTGLTALPLGSVLMGNGTGQVLSIAPGPSGSVLTSNGTSWESQAPAALQGNFGGMYSQYFNGVDCNGGVASGVPNPFPNPDPEGYGCPSGFTALPLSCAFGDAGNRGGTLFTYCYRL
ncbi:MAG: hypothetical protein Q7R85_04820, partial [bacterium]|nr:hypothetical protein [bacterium]